jgi:hypothetical protein
MAIMHIENPDTYYRLAGTCVGCRRVTWLCRRYRRCSKYSATPKRGHEAMPTGFAPSPLPRSGEDMGARLEGPGRRIHA